MNKLLLLSIALLSVNLYGQERPAISLTGLEGWAKADPTQNKPEGVSIRVEDYSKRDKAFDVKAIENQVELKLRLAGIKIHKVVTADRIYINMQPIELGGRVVGYYLLIEPSRKMTFKHKGKSYVSYVAKLTKYGGATPPKYKEALDDWLNRLLLDYLKANPKKE